MIACLMVFVTALFLFRSGIVFELTREYPDSISLSEQSIIEFRDLSDINQYYIEYYLEGDIYGIQWLSRHRSKICHHLQSRT